MKNFLTLLGIFLFSTGLYAENFPKTLKKKFIKTNYHKNFYLFLFVLLLTLSCSTVGTYYETSAFNQINQLSPAFQGSLRAIRSTNDGGITWHRYSRYLPMSVYSNCIVDLNGQTHQFDQINEYFSGGVLFQSASIPSLNRRYVFYKQNQYVIIIIYPLYSNQEMGRLVNIREGQSNSESNGLVQ